MLFSRRYVNQLCLLLGNASFFRFTRKLLYSRRGEWQVNFPSKLPNELSFGEHLWVETWFDNFAGYTQPRKQFSTMQKKEEKKRPQLGEVSLGSNAWCGCVIFPYYIVLARQHHLKHASNEITQLLEGL